MIVEALIPLRTKTGLNSREHWAQRAKRVATERAAVRLLLGIRVQAALLVGGSFAPPFVVELTRISPRLADLDNVAGGLKGCRDEIAELLGLDDGDPRIRFFYHQQQGPFGVRVAIHSNSRLETRIVPASQEEANAVR